MTKVNEVVIDALEDIVVQADEAPIEPSEAKAAMRMLNDMMFAWAANGINLGYTSVSDLGDEVTVPAGAIMGIKAYLAIYMASKYDIDVPPEVAVRAKEGMKAILNLVNSITETAFPCTLPQGSGNNYPGYANNTFFPDLESLVLTETGGAIALEDDTEEAS
jgi:hypothetical protein